MWPGTLAKFTIGECSFKKITTPALVGIFKFDIHKSASSLLTQHMEDARIRRSITVGSYLGDCVGFPMNNEAVEILRPEHSEILDTYIKTIPQKSLFFFSDGEMYTHAMMQLLVEIGKEQGKHITCLGTLPARFEGSRIRNSFFQSWGIIEELADESILFDFESSESYAEVPDSKLSIVGYYSLRLSTVLEKVIEIEGQSDSFEYYTRTY